CAVPRLGGGGCSFAWGRGPVARGGAGGGARAPAFPAPLQLRRGLEDLPAGLLGLAQDFVDPVLAAHDVIEHDAAEAAALRAHAHHVSEPVAAVEADQRTAVGNEEHRDLVVVLDLPAQPFCVEALGPVHVIDAEQYRADLRVHSIYPL